MSNGVERCGAATRSGGRCGKPAGWGTGHRGVGRCKLHGGATPNHEVGGAVALARRELQGMARPLPLPIAPEEALLQLIEIVAGQVAFALERVSALDTDELLGPLRTIVERPLKKERGAESAVERVEEIHDGPPTLNAWVRVLNEAIDRLHGLIRTALAANIAERRIAVARAHGLRLAEAMRSTLIELGIDVNDPQVIAVVRRNLLRAAGVPDGTARLPAAA